MLIVSPMIGRYSSELARDAFLVVLVVPSEVLRDLAGRQMGPVPQMSKSVASLSDVHSASHAGAQMNDHEIERLQGIVAFMEAAGDAERDGLNAEIKRLRNVIARLHVELRAAKAEL